MTAVSSRQNETDSSLLGSLRLWNRSFEMKPSICSSSARNLAA